jgi:hypothetical protein
MEMMDRALELSKAQGRAATEASQAISACVAAMLEASASFAKTTAERNIALATTLMSAKSLDAAAEIHAAFLRDSIRAASQMAAKIADACDQASKQCNELAVAAMERAVLPMYN